MSTPITMAVTDGTRTLAWTGLDALGDTTEKGTVAGGVLVGDPELEAAFHQALGPDGPEQVKVYVPSGYYTFTQGRDTPADVAAALFIAAGPRANLDGKGWDVMYESVFGSDAFEEDVPDGVIY